MATPISSKQKEGKLSETNSLPKRGRPGQNFHWEGGASKKKEELQIRISNGIKRNRKVHLIIFAKILPHALHS